MNAIGVPPAGPGPLSRRTLIIFGGTAALSLAGCSATGRQKSDPDRSATAPAPTPKPTPLPGTVAAAQQENDLAAFAAAALHRFGSKLSGAERNLLTNLHQAHLAHATALQQPDPFDVGPVSAPATPPTPSPSSTQHKIGKSPKSALKSLHALEAEAAKTYASQAVAPTGPEDQLGDLALLWGSLAAAADCYADACASRHNPGSSVVGDQRTKITKPGAQTALQQLLQQCYAIIFGYQAAIAALSGDRAERAQLSLADYRDLRDQLTGQLTDAKATVPAPQPAYRLPVQPTDNAKAARLINTMESRILPYLGQWLRSTSDDRPDATKTLINSSRDAVSWSVKITVWPGYPLA